MIVTCRHSTGGTQLNNVLKVGTMAYYDTLRSGLVPCKVVSITEDKPGKQGLHFELSKGGIPQRYRANIRITTGAHCGYRKGELLVTHAYHVVPRVCIKRRRYSTYILPYTVELTGGI